MSLTTSVWCIWESERVWIPVRERERERESLGVLIGFCDVGRELRRWEFTGALTQMCTLSERDVEVWALTHTCTLTERHVAALLITLLSCIRSIMWPPVPALLVSANWKWDDLTSVLQYGHVSCLYTSCPSWGSQGEQTRSHCKFEVWIVAYFSLQAFHVVFVCLPNHLFMWQNLLIYFSFCFSVWIVFVAWLYTYPDTELISIAIPRQIIWTYESRFFSRFMPYMGVFMSWERENSAWMAQCAQSIFHLVSHKNCSLSIRPTW